MAMIKHMAMLNSMNGEVASPRTSIVESKAGNNRTSTTSNDESETKLKAQDPFEVGANLFQDIGLKATVLSTAIWVFMAGFMLLHQDWFFQNSYFQVFSNRRNFASVLDGESDVEKRVFTFVMNIGLLCLFGAMIEVATVIWRSIHGFYQYFLMSELDLQKRYGKGSWVVITGPDSGQGRRFTFELAERGFNILMIGYGKRCSETREEVLEHLKENNFQAVDIQVISKDFRFAAEYHFFDDIEAAVQRLNVSILINNVGHRFGWTSFHEMPEEKINDSIIVGTIVQSRMTRIVLPKFVERKEKFDQAKAEGREHELDYQTSSLVNITAQCLAVALGPAFPFGPALSLPYLSVYEGANVFGYFQGMSIFREYENQFDILNITPGAVLTDNTYDALRTTPMACGEGTFVRNIIRFMGNVQGNSNACVGHALAMYLAIIAPFLTRSATSVTGFKIATFYKKMYENGYYGGPRITRKESAETTSTSSTNDDATSTASTDETSAPCSPIKDNFKSPLNGEDAGMRLRAAIH